jgi:hypothetical protein
MQTQNFTQNRPDDEGLMVLIELKALSEYTQKISAMMNNQTQLPAWVQSKIAVAKSSLDEVFHFLDGINTFQNTAMQNQTLPINTQSSDDGGLIGFDEFVQKTENPMGDVNDLGGFPEQTDDLKLQDFDEIIGGETPDTSEEEVEEEETEDEETEE